LLEKSNFSAKSNNSVLLGDQFVVSQGLIKHNTNKHEENQQTYEQT